MLLMHPTCCTMVWDYWVLWPKRYTLPETNSSHLKIGGPLIGIRSIPTIHFLGRSVSGRVVANKNNTMVAPVDFQSRFVDLVGWKKNPQKTWLGWECIRLLQWFAWLPFLLVCVLRCCKALSLDFYFFPREYSGAGLVLLHTMTDWQLKISLHIEQIG